MLPTVKFVRKFFIWLQVIRDSERGPISDMEAIRVARSVLAALKVTFSFLELVFEISTHCTAGDAFRRTGPSGHQASQHYAMCP
mmetsp:Transcript_36824/g.97844  ORF Transcript_36824/g.97844 Transcript_36824/m.97844 type:complete len:84 (+) Transcript_36824:3333-3584(+)